MKIKEITEGILDNALKFGQRNASKLGKNLVIGTLQSLGADKAAEYVQKKNITPTKKQNDATYTRQQAISDVEAAWDKKYKTRPINKSTDSNSSMISAPPNMLITYTTPNYKYFYDKNSDNWKVVDLKFWGPNYQEFSQVPSDTDIDKLSKLHHDKKTKMETNPVNLKK